MNKQRQRNCNLNKQPIRSMILSSTYLKPIREKTMGISINTNVAATKSGFYLANNHQALQKSMDRLSSGRRITEPADDAGGLAVSMKLESVIRRLRATSYNVSNAVSLLQVQDGVMKSAADIVTRIGELKAMHSDVTKSTSDKATYDGEFRELQGQLWDLAQTKFNGIALFGDLNDANGHPGTINVNNKAFATDSDGDGVVDDDDPLNVLELFTTEDGSSGPSVLIHQTLMLSGLTLAQDTNAETYIVDANGWDDTNTGSGLGGGPVDGTFSLANADPTTSTLSLDDLQMGFITQALQNLATMRATNGGKVRNLQYTLDNIETQITNHTAANGRIVDVDIARESSNLAKQQVLVQSAATMTAQANLINDVALMLIRGN